MANYAEQIEQPRPSVDYGYASSEPSHTHAYLWDPVLKELAAIHRSDSSPRRVFDLGCGNGALMAHLQRAGYEPIGVDPSTSGIEMARRHWPDLQTHVGSAYDELAAQYGQFPAVVSLEVVEHVYAPRRFAATLFSLVQPGGVAIVSTPYHGYLKNLAIALTGKFDAHFTALWDHGHIKFWSRRTLSILLKEAGFSDIHFRRVGRIPALAKSMIAIARRDHRA